MERVYHPRALQPLHVEPAGVALLDRQRRHLRHDPDRDRLSVPVLAAPPGPVSAAGGDPPPLQFGVLMGLFYFSFVMVMGHMSFVRPEWVARLGHAWKRKIGDMEMIYDGKCGFCVRSMARFLAFDGVGQI